MPTHSITTDTAADLVVIGAGIVGLAHAAEGLARGLRVHVIERDERAVGASVRNFGHVCATAQSGQALTYALAARERWITLGEQAGFGVKETGTVVVARTEAELAVLGEFAAARGTEQALLLDSDATRALFPPATADVLGGAHLPLDLRVDPREALPAIAAWLEAQGVRFSWATHVGAVDPVADGVQIRTSRGTVRSARVVHATGHDVDRLFPQVAEKAGVRRCRLQMLEVAPPGDVEIEPAVLTGLSMLRYGGFAETTAAAGVRTQFEATGPELLDVVMNLMLTQRPGTDGRPGSIVLGDTHHYDRTHQPFDDEYVAELVLREGARLLGAPLTIRRRWRGVYADSPHTDFLVDEPFPGLRVVSVTSGIGMTTALGLAPAVLDQLL
ncbi:TIGR03364 family FAD-dependent oxidoreductase [Nocardioides sp. NBC_00368]|uniref:TIGR03364 family FAD-dependent oxidoreductase n=1 Tax=Nocardioides sp. NBC_00368 TaxID=2976000 RepID=UPI002E1EC477